MAESEIHKIAKMGIVQAFVDKGWMVGTEQRVDGGKLILDVKLQKKDDIRFVEVKFTHESEYWKWKEQQKSDSTQQSDELQTQQGPQRPEWMTDKILQDTMLSILSCFESGLWDNEYSITYSTRLSHRYEYDRLLRAITKRNFSKDEAKMAIDISKELGILNEWTRGVFTLHETLLGKLNLELKNRTIDRELLRRREIIQNEEISKVKRLMDVFDKLSNRGNNDVNEQAILYQLTRTWGPFVNRMELAKQYLNKACKNGQIYERREGWYAKA